MKGTTIERWFRELKNRTKRFHNNVNSKTLKSIEDIATAVAIVHNLVRTGRGGGNTNLTVPSIQTPYYSRGSLKVLKGSLHLTPAIHADINPKPLADSRARDSRCRCTSQNTISPP